MGDAVRGLGESVTSLLQFKDPSADLRDPSYAQYSLFKLGVIRSVDHYARRIAPLIRESWEVYSSDRSWVVASAPFARLRNSANLLCSRAWELIRDDLPSELEFCRRDIRKYPDPLRFSDKNFSRYSELSLEEREKAAERSLAACIRDSGFNGCAVVFIDDIRVTGTQQDIIRRYLKRAGASYVSWMYLIDVAKSIARTMPELEYRLNMLGVPSFESFARILVEEEVEPTLKCIWRLFTYNRKRIEILGHQLNGDVKKKLLEMAKREGFLEVRTFAEKMYILGYENRE